MNEERTPVVESIIRVEAMADHIVMIVPIGTSTIGVRFTSPEHLLGIMKELIDTAAKVWPENKWMKEYLED